MTTKTVEDIDYWQNPLYPRDAAMSVAEMEVMARSGSFHRAHSPGARICKVDYFASPDDPTHTHDYQTFMNFRHDHVVGDDDPWTFWLLYDDWLAIYVPPPVPIPPKQPVGWFTRARVNPGGIQYMNGWTQGWTGYTFANVIGPSRFLKGFGTGTQTRIILQGDCVFGSVYIGPISEKPFVATALYRLTFGGSFSGTTGPQPDWELISDPLPQGIDTSNGLMISGYVSGPHLSGPVGWLRTRNPEADWYSRYRLGDYAAVLDKSKVGDPLKPATGWVVGGVSDFAVLQVDAYYPPPP
jgi:hypothetical protein